MADSRHAYPTLDLMRGIAALAVVIYHVPSLKAVVPVASAPLAVDLFFLLSGFVISHAYGQKLAAGWSTLDFMRVRLIRLWPLHMLALAAAAAVAMVPVISGSPPVMGWTPYAAALPTAVFFLPTWPFSADTPLFPLNIPVWSLFFELISNLAAVLIWRRLGNRLLAVIIGVSAVALTVLFLATGDLDQGTVWGTLPGGLARVMFSFFLGVALYRMRARFSKFAVHPLILAAVMIALLAPNLAGSARGAYGLVAVLVICPLLVAAGSASKPWTGAAPFFLLAGQVSYALYVLHTPGWDILGAMVGLATHQREAWQANPLLGVAFLALILPAAWIAATYFDAPVRRFLTGARKG